MFRASVVMITLCCGVAHAEAPYAVTEADATLLGDILQTSAGIERNSRMTGGIVTTGLGAAVTLGGLGLLLSDPSEEGEIIGWTFTGAGAAMLIGGLLVTAITGTIEDLDEEMRSADLSTPEARSQHVLRIEGRFMLEVRNYRRTRQVSGWTVFGFGVLSGAVALGRMVGGEQFDGSNGLMLGTGIGFIGLGVWTALSGTSPIEEMWALYERRRAIPWEVGAPPVIRPVLAPIDGGLIIGLDGTF